MIPDRLRSFADFEKLLAGTANYEERMPLGTFEEDFDLARMGALLQSVGHPQIGPTTVHITGSKGKGSTSHMVAAILRAAGMGPVGLYISPHFEHLTERASVDGKAVPGSELSTAAAALLPHLATTEGTRRHPTYFELLTAAAHLAFRRRGVRSLVLEVGLGGRLDATTVCKPSVCAITSIELEHTALLGDTVEKIAAEKAGILKERVPVVSAVPAGTPADLVIEKAALHLHAPLHRLGVDITMADAATGPGPVTHATITGPGGAAPVRVSVPVAGVHQARNAAVATAITRLLHIPDAAIVKGLSTVSLPGRMEQVLGRPMVVIDGAHTAASAAATRAALDACFDYRRLHLIVGMLEEKDVQGILRPLLPRTFRVIACGVPSPRGMAQEKLAKAIRELTTTPVFIAADAASALRDSFSHCVPNDLMLVTGSTYLAGAARSAVRAYPGFLPTDPDPRAAVEAAAP